MSLYLGSKTCRGQGMFGKLMVHTNTGEGKVNRGDRVKVIRR